MSYLSKRLGLTRYEADEYYNQALEAYQNLELEDAIDNMSFAITLLPMNSEYYAVRGMFYMEEDVSEKARRDFQKALEIHAGELLANYGMGVLAFRESKWEDALLWFNKARAVNPTQVEVPYYIAMTYHRQQDNETAKAYMQQAVDLMKEAGDKRRSDAEEWVKTFQRLIRQAREDESEPMVQPELPITGAASGTRVSSEELNTSPSAGQLPDGDPPGNTHNQ